MKTRLLPAMALIMLAGAYFVPLWHISLQAPQYPEGIRMTIWINRITGKLNIINLLNDYVGMKHITPESIKELTIMPYAVGFLILIGVFCLIFENKILLCVWLFSFILLGLTGMVDFYKWGYDYGHHLSPDAPIKVPGMSYQPPLIGFKHLLNFTAYSYPGLAAFLLAGAAALCAAALFLKRNVSTWRVRILLAAACVILALASCQGLRPAPVLYGKEACDYCKMLIVDPHYGGEIITNKGKIYKFDDIGCMVSFSRANLSENEISAYLVMNFTQPEKWLKAQHAFYLLCPKLPTPMRSDLTAFENMSDLEKIKKEYCRSPKGTSPQGRGKVLKWEDVLKQVFRKSSPLPEKGIIVCQDCPVHSIKQALLLAKPFQQIIVRGGVYREAEIVIKKPVIIAGESSPVFDGKNRDEIITIKSDDVHIKGITIRNSGKSYVKDLAGIRFDHVKNCSIENSLLSNDYFAIYLYGSKNCTIKNNFIKGESRIGITSDVSSGDGIHAWHCDKLTISGNTITGQRDGIYLEFVNRSMIDENTSTQNSRYGLHFMFSDSDTYVNNTFRENGTGAAVMYSRKIKMAQNRFLSNWGSASYGLLFKNMEESTALDNLFENNTVGIDVEDSQRNDFKQNNFKQNGFAVKVWSDSSHNDFKKNNFCGNTFDVSGEESSNQTNIFSENYWDSYAGYDLNKDGIGDVPYQPVRLSSLLFQKLPPSAVLLRSLFISLLDLSERVSPSVTPVIFIDEKPEMRQIHD